MSKTLPIAPARAEQILRAHNVERARHGVQPLTWDWSLAQTAQRWASQCRFQHWKDSERSIGSEAFRATQPPGAGGGSGQWPLGENLAINYMVGQGPVSARGSVTADGWINERADWKCGVAVASGDCAPGKMCGHLTQMLWADTTRVGCAVQECPNGFPEVPGSRNGELLVCEYSPPGNFLGRTPFPAAQCKMQTVTPSNVPANIPPFPGSSTPTTNTRRLVPIGGGGGSGNTTVPIDPTKPLVPVTPNASPNRSPPFFIPTQPNRPAVPTTSTPPSPSLPPQQPTVAVPILPPTGFTPLVPQTNVPGGGTGATDDSNVLLVTAPDGTEIFVPISLQQRVQQLTSDQLTALANLTRDALPADQPLIVATFLQEIDGGGSRTSTNGTAAGTPPANSSETEFWKSVGIALGVVAGVLVLSLLIGLIVWLSTSSRRNDKQRLLSPVPSAAYYDSSPRNLPLNR